MLVQRVTLWNKSALVGNRTGRRGHDPALLEFLFILRNLIVSVKVDMGKNQSYNERAYRLRNSKGGRPWNLEVVTAHPAEVDKTAERGLSVNKILASPS